MLACRPTPRALLRHQPMAHSTAGAATLAGDRYGFVQEICSTAEPRRARQPAHRGATQPELLRQLFIKALRWSPVSPLVLASALQVFIFSCCLLMSSWDMPLDDRQLDMNDLRSAPVTPLALASAAHSFIFSCWLFRCGDCVAVAVCARAA